MRLLLRELGIEECWEAADGASALHLVKHHKPDLVLLDINLPGMSGLQVLGQIRQLAPDLPVVMATAQSSMSTVSEAVRLGASGYLLKHCPKEETLEALRDILESLSEEPEVDAKP